MEYAARELGRPVEMIVVANRCTDATAQIASGAGAVVVESTAPDRYFFDFND